jgi:hypothetical protein
MTIAQQIKWDFKTNGVLQIRDKNDSLIYFETSSGFWAKREYDSQDNLIYMEDSKGLWAKYEFDSQGNVIYCEDSNGVIADKRPKSCENKEILIGGEKFKLVKV